MQRFGPFEVDFANAELRKSGLRVRIQDQPLRILQVLMERQGELVSREELQGLLWPADTFVDFERSLNAAVGKLRQTLNDSADHPRYIETVARKGYRFIMPITESKADSAPQIALEPQPVLKADRNAWLSIASAASLVLVLG